MSGWKEDTAKQASRMAEQQFAYQQKLINQREAERTAAMGQMESLMRNPPNYRIPTQVQQYTDLMNVLGGQLYGIQDASGGAKSIDASQFRSQTEPVDQWQSRAGAFNPAYDNSGSDTGGDTGGGWRGGGGTMRDDIVDKAKELLNSGGRTTGSGVRGGGGTMRNDILDKAKGLLKRGK